jgi:hypothetical protein
MKINRSSWNTVSPAQANADASAPTHTPRAVMLLHREKLLERTQRLFITTVNALTLTGPACTRAAAIGYTGKYRQTLLLHPTEKDTTVFAIGCTVVLGKLDDP